MMIFFFLLNLFGENLQSQEYNYGFVFSYMQLENGDNFPVLATDNQNLQSIANNVNEVISEEYEDIEITDYNIDYQSDEFLTLDIERTQCGFYCEYNIHDKLNFLLVNGGRLFSLINIFDNKELRNFNQIHSQNVLKKIKKFMKNHKLNENQTFIYNICLNRDFYIDEYTKFEISKNSLTIYAERCSNHATKSIDILGEIPIKYLFTEIKTSLNKKFITYFIK